MTQTVEVSLQASQLLLQVRAEVQELDADTLHVATFLKILGSEDEWTHKLTVKRGN